MGLSFGEIAREEVWEMSGEIGSEGLEEVVCVCR
jgi:hypothetical protein